MRTIISCLVLIAAVFLLYSCCDECASETKEKVQSEASEKLDALNAQIAKLSALAAEAGKEAGAEIEKAVTELKAMSEQAKAKLQELKDAGEDKWEEAGTAVSSSLEALDKKYQEILEKYGK